LHLFQPPTYHHHQQHHYYSHLLLPFTLSFCPFLCYYSYRSTSEAFVDEIVDKTVVQFAVERWMRGKKVFCWNVLTANATYHNKCENVVRAVKGDVLLIDNEIKRSFGFGLHFEKFFVVYVMLICVLWLGFLYGCRKKWQDRDISSKRLVLLVLVIYFSFYGKTKPRGFWKIIQKIAVSFFCEKTNFLHNLAIKHKKNLHN
jgi:uncharacterized membrane protein